MLRAPPSTLAALHDRLPLQGHRQRLPAQLRPRLAPTSLVRALYRAWLSTQVGWAPLVVVRRDLLGPVGTGSLWAEVRAQATGGWLFVDGSLTADEVALLGEGCARLLDLDPEAPPLHLDYDLRDEIERIDPWHAALTDPTLAEPRRQLARLDPPTFATISGPPGAGREGLLQSAAFAATGRPALPPPGPLGHRGWLQIPAVEDLDRDPVILAGLRDQLRLAAEAQVLPSPVLEEAPPRPSHAAFDPIIGESRAIRRALHLAARSALRTENLLLLGPTGTGKMEFARAIHKASGRKGPFVAVDIGARANDLVDSEIFGTEKGSHSAADQARPGWFEQAHKGTLFIDEVANIPLALQTRLLQPVQERTVRRIGAPHDRPFDVRIIVATNVSLREMCDRGTFREDLYARLAEVILYLPPLCDRRGDILRIATHLLGLPPGTPWCDLEAQERLEAWRWPRNVRELSAVVKQARENANGGLVQAAHLEFDDPRRTVVLIASDEVATWPASLRAEEIRRCRATTFTVPSLTARGPLAIRNAVLAGLGGLPIAAAALAQLERARWSRLGDLQSLLTRLREADRPIGTESLADVNLDLHPQARTPVVLRLHPVLEIDPANGGNEPCVASPIRELESDVIVLGRAGRLAEVEEQLDHASHPAANAQLRSQLRGRVLSLVSLPGHEQMSRVQVIVQRGPQGLTLTRSLRANALIVLAGPLDGLEPVALHPGQSVHLGEAAELCLYSKSRSQQRLLARVFLCLGQAVDQARQAAMVESLRRRHDVAGHTEGVDSPDRKWSVDPAEADAICGLFCHLAEAGLTPKAGIKEWVAASADTPDLHAICAYFGRNHPTQQVARLVSHAPNRALRARLRSWLAHHPDPDRVKEALGNMLVSAFSEEEA